MKVDLGGVRGCIWVPRRVLKGTFRKLGYLILGVLIIRILLFRVLYWGPLFSETPTCLDGFQQGF